MLKINKNQKGVTLLETTLALAILGIVMLFLIKYTVDQNKELKLQNSAKQIESVLENAKTLVKENFKDYYNQAQANSSLLISLDMDDVMEVYNSSDILSYKSTRAPLGGTYRAFVRIPYDITNTPQEKNLQVILYVLNSSKNIKILEAQKVARLIDNGEGGIVYISNSPASPCSGNICLGSASNSWIIPLPSSPRTIFDANVSSSLNSVSGDLSLAPAIVALSNITETDSIGDYLNKEENTDNIQQNTMMTDLNIDDYSDSESNSAIFFNGLKDPASSNSNKLIGVNLAYQSNSGDPSLATSGFILSNNDDTATAQPMFLSGGGLKTNLQAEEGDSCNVYSQGRVIAVDINSGELLSCQAVSEDSSIPSTPDYFQGNWEKIDWRRSIYLLNKVIPLATGLSATSGTLSLNRENLSDILEEEIVERAEFLIVSPIIRGNGNAYLRTDMSNPLYEILNTTTNSNQTSQAIIPYLEETSNSSTNLQLRITNDSSSNIVTYWTINVIGYIDLD